MARRAANATRTHAGACAERLPEARCKSLAAVDGGGRLAVTCCATCRSGGSLVSQVTVTVAALLCVCEAGASERGLRGSRLLAFGVRN